jgi:hypothetical protein
VRDIPLDEITDPAERAKKLFRPSKPVTERLFLVGRDEELDRTTTTLEMPGRCVFIFGERGVGKTSLAKTAAQLQASSTRDPLYFTADDTPTFGAFITALIRALMPTKRYKATFELKLNSSLVQIVYRLEERPEDTVSLEPGMAVDVLNALVPEGEKLVVILDELDRATPELKKKLAHFVKQVGDRDCPVKFIFAGIADDVHILMDEHESALRYVSTVKLDQLRVGHLTSIATTGFKQLDIKLPDHYASRIALLSAGFAHFTHLVCLHLALITIADGSERVTASGFEKAIEEAVKDSDILLSRLYKQAVQKYENYEPVLWAVADHYLLERSSGEIYYDSYLRICREMGMTVPADETEIDESSIGPEPQEEGTGSPSSNTQATQRALTKSEFQRRLYYLRDKSHGEVLVWVRKNWYRFREPMLRGYCRLIARQRGTEVGLTYLDSRNSLCEWKLPKDTG